MEKNVNNLMGTSLDKIKGMVDVDMAVGKPVELPDGTTLIPVSRLSYGFVAGGSDLPNKADRDIFGGGSGAGINVTPVAFLIVKDGNVNMMPIVSKPDSLDRAISLIPELVDKVSNYFKKEEAVTAAQNGEQVSEISID